MKKQILVGIMGLAILACQGDPQKKAEREAEKMADKANTEAAKAEGHLQKTMEHTASSVNNATLSAMNEALSKVQVPHFEKNATANELVKKIGNLGIDFVNSEKLAEADSYAAKIRSALEQVGELETKGRLSVDEAGQIRNYANNLAAALEMSLP